MVSPFVKEEDVLLLEIPEVSFACENVITVEFADTIVAVALDVPPVIISAPENVPTTEVIATFELVNLCLK